MNIELVLYNGNIYTLNPQQPKASAIALMWGRVVAVGSDAEMLALAGANTRRENLNGRTVLPGLIDAHLHWAWTSMSLQAVDVFEVPSKQAALDAVAQRVSQTPVGEWIRGHGWAQDLWADKSFPTAADLDAVAPHNPVYLTGKSMHVAWVNSAALQAAGITAQTPQPDGGEIHHLPDGTPSGILLEAPAIQLVRQHLPKPTPEQLVAMMRDAQAQALRCGLVGFHDLDNPEVMVALQMLREQGELAVRVVKYINKPFLDASIESGVRFGLGDDWLRYGGLKLFADGALGPRTASMLEPYEGEPNNYGIIVTPKEDMLAAALQATRAGLPTAIHAIGDRAVRDVLDIFEVVRAEEARLGIPRGARRHRIEHVQIIHPQDVGRLAALDIIASMQPIHAVSDAETADRYWGQRAALSYNARAQLDAGAVLAFGSDAPIEPFNPFLGIYAAVARKRADGTPQGGWRTDAALTLHEALRAFTYGAAFAAGTEHQQGQLKRGYYADLIVLEQDLFTQPIDALPHTQVLASMVNGVWRYGGIS